MLVPLFDFVARHQLLEQLFLMVRRCMGALFALIFLPAAADAQSVCLPKAVFQKGPDGRLPTLQLANEAIPTLCAWQTTDRQQLLGCWSINPSSGVLRAVNPVAPHGYSVSAMPDAAGCIRGYCAPLLHSPASSRLIATSTGADHVVVQDEKFLHVFHAGSKVKAAQIKLSDADADRESNVTNQPVQLLFADDTIYVVGSDAGPYIAVWRFRKDGTRLGRINHPGAKEGFNIFQGSISILDDAIIGLADAGLQHIMIIPRAGGPGRRVKRSARHAPCSKLQMDAMAEGDLTQPSSCRHVIRRYFEPFFDAPLARLPSGDFLAALTGPQQGRISILSGADLAEKVRVPLKRCD